MTDFTAEDLDALEAHVKAGWPIGEVRAIGLVAALRLELAGRRSDREKAAEAVLNEQLRTTNAEAKVERLTAWKDEALTVLADWEKVYDALGRPGLLGESKARAALVEVEALRARIDPALACPACGGTRTRRLLSPPCQHPWHGDGHGEEASA